MAGNLNSFNPNSLDFGLINDAMDHFLLSLNSNLDQNNVNGSTFINSQLFGSNSIISVHQNNPTPQADHARVSHGQLGLSQRLSEVRRTYVAPHRVQVHSFIDYFPVQQQNQSICPQHEVTVTEIVRTTKFLTSTPKMEPLFTPNDIFHPHDQHNFQNHGLPISNILNHHSLIKSEPFYSPYPSLESNKNQMMNTYDGDMNGDLVQPLALTGQEHTNHLMMPKSPVQQFPHRHTNPPAINLHEIKVESDTNGNLLSHRKRADHMMTVKYLIQQLRRTHPNASNLQTNTADMGSSDTEDDGRTHSLPHEKYGPYTCPKCRNVFSVSQTFAAHMLTHYKNESSDQRKKRLAAKYKRKNLRLVYRRGGMTLLPESSKARGKSVNMVDNSNVRNEVQEGQGNAEATTSNFPVNSMIKGQGNAEATTSIFPVNSMIKGQGNAEATTSIFPVNSMIKGQGNAEATTGNFPVNSRIKQEPTTI
ncbi:hypothetical protein RCOM_0146500 [Ricinus communis]|uniref:C2H2-type domain-containing protein n=1 Tax=Ricinus communis TaxID=3988 RepID=B9SQ56_RICCO|nr:hypothetical protein RCOM_0146500 [Ricinus communis]